MDAKSKIVIQRIYVVDSPWITVSPNNHTKHICTRKEYLYYFRLQNQSATNAQIHNSPALCFSFSYKKNTKKKKLKKNGNHTRQDLLHTMPSPSVEKRGKKEKDKQKNSGEKQK